MTERPTGSAKFARVLSRAEENLWTSFEEAREFVQRGDIGDVREDAVARFLRDRLPSRFAVASGEVVDTSGAQSGQTDVLIYDASLTAPLVQPAQGNVLLAAEALLATVEVKSKLTKSECEKAARGVAQLHALRPWDAPFGVVIGQNGQRTEAGLPRILTSVFAYSTDLKQEDWAESELSRVRAACSSCETPLPYLDRVLVLDRGLIHPSLGKVLLVQEQGVLGDWFFTLANFLTREAVRRRTFPWKDYHHTVGRPWTAVGPPLFDAPPAARATGRERLKARSRRNKRN